MTPHRIAITGASSVGKTTLARALMNDQWFRDVVPVLIPEGARSLLRSMGHTSFDGLARSELLDFQRRFFAWKQAEESRYESYLVDRSFVDVAALWLERDTFDLPQEVQNEMAIPCRQLASRYSLLVHVSPEAIEFEYDGERESDLDLHARVAARIARSLVEWELPYITVASPSLDARVEAVKEHILRANR